MTERRVIWTPTERQRDFLAAPEEEVLYGGAAGGGKSDALIIDALGGIHGAASMAEYRAIILRRTYDELREVIDRTTAVYPQSIRGATYHVADKYWSFPSGARIELGYLDRDQDVMRYQSRQFQWIGWEELAQWPTPYAYTYMISRLRRPARMNIPVYVRATCNPDGPGVRWIAERWGIAADGRSTRSETTVEGHRWRRRFIAARLSDNPHLAGTGYREQLLALPDEIRRALLDGRWDEPIVGGAIYAEALSLARTEGRITRVPVEPTVRVDTAWDLGVGDATAIWFSQTVGREVRLVDYYEASGEGLPHYAAMLDRRGYLYGRHIAPHDIAVREFSSGVARIDAARSLGINFERAPARPVGSGCRRSRGGWGARDDTAR